MRCGLVRDLPYAVKSDQIVQIDIRVRRVIGSVPAEENIRNVSCLSYRDHPTIGLAHRRLRPLLEAVGDQTSDEVSLRVGEKDPGVLVERLSEHIDVARAEGVAIEVNNPHNLVVVRRTAFYWRRGCGHAGPPAPGSARLGAGLSARCPLRTSDLPGDVTNTGPPRTAAQSWQAKIGKDAADHITAGYGLDDLEVIDPERRAILGDLIRQTNGHTSLSSSWPDPSAEYSQTDDCNALRLVA